MAGLAVDAETAKIVGAGIAALVAGLFGRSILKRRWSRDAVAGAVDESGIDLLASVREERKDWHERERELLARIDAANVERYNAIAEAARLNAEIIVLKQRIQSASGEIEELNAEISRLKALVEVKLEEARQLEAEVTLLRERVFALMQKDTEG